jgi:hypothetical protein
MVFDVTSLNDHRSAPLEAGWSAAGCGRVTETYR